MPDLPDIPDVPSSWLPAWAQGLLAIVVFFSAAAKPASRWIGELMRDRQRLRREVQAEDIEAERLRVAEAWLAGFTIGKEVDSLLDMVSSSTGAMRANLLRLDNGSGIPIRPDAVCYVTLLRTGRGLNAEADQEAPTVLGRRVAVISPAYREAAAKCFLDGQSLLMADRLDEADPLRVILHRPEASPNIHFYRIRGDAQTMLFLSLHMPAGRDVVPPPLDAVVGTTVLALRDLFGQGPNGTIGPWTP